MKFFKIEFTIAFLLLSIIEIYSQTEKGNFLIGGDTKLNFTSTKFTTSNQSSISTTIKSFEFSPQAGIFVMKGLSLGLVTQFTFSSNKIEGTVRLKSSSLVVAPFAKYYFGAKNIKPYLQACSGYGTRHTKFDRFNTATNEYDKVQNSYGIFLYEVDAGLGIFINDNISFDFGLGYAYESTKLKGQSNSNKDIQKGLGATVGIIILL